MPSNKVVASEGLLAYQKMEFIGFIHFSINTFTGKEWGFGDEDPRLFNPTNLDTDQWAKIARDVGMKQLILTAKHHDGFCLWPSKHTSHTIKNSPYKNGNGDIVREFVNSCRKFGLKIGLYLSPWDRNHKNYGKPEYLDFYKSQLEELLTQYGEINEIWFDGANGGDGFYGGAKEIREIEPASYYNWDEINDLVKSLQPNINIFSDRGPDVHCIGNEDGYAGETFWSTFNPDRVVIGQADTSYLNIGDPQGKSWVIGQCDVSIRPGWFYHESEDLEVKTDQQLVELYYKSVGRNAVMLLNIPPDRRGLIHDVDIKNLKEFRNIIDNTFSRDLIHNGRFYANSIRNESELFSPDHVCVDNDNFWATNDSILPAKIEIHLNHEITFDRVLLQEPIHLGQRVSKFEINILQQHKWVRIARGTTIGYKRLLRLVKVKTKSIQLIIIEANNTVAISRWGVFLSDKEVNE